MFRMKNKFNNSPLSLQSTFSTFNIEEADSEKMKKSRKSQKLSDRGENSSSIPLGI